MGVPVVFHHVADQPHTSSPHFASFPYGLPDHRFMVMFFLPAPLQDHEPTISSTISFPICEHIFISPTSYRNSPMGPPPFILFSKKFMPSLGHSFHTGAPVSVFVHFSEKLFIIYCTNAFIFQLFTFVVTVGDLLSFWPHTTHVTLGWRITSHLPSPASSISSEYYPGHLPLPSEFVHLVLPLAQLILGLGIPLTLDLVTRLWPLFISYILQPRAVLSLPTS
jgi:hypothetical protein